MPSPYLGGEVEGKTHFAVGKTEALVFRLEMSFVGFPGLLGMPRTLFLISLI